MPLGAEPGGDSRRRLELDPVALAVVDGEGEQPMAALAGDRGRDHGIEAPRKERDGFGRGRHDRGG